MKLKFIIKQYLKMFVHNVFLPGIYKYYSRVPIIKGKIIFADSHNDIIPFNMQHIYKALINNHYTVELHISNYSKLNAVKLVTTLLAFMKSYAEAEYVFICDNFLPVSSCKKRPETKVIQLWHSGGLLKKMAYDTMEDIPAYYHGEVYKNYDLVTVSAPCCINIWANAMRISDITIKPLGISRTDIYYDESWINTCKNTFYKNYPEAVNKRIVLWAPTFRGNASEPKLHGVNEMNWLQDKLKSEYFFIFKLHPHMQTDTSSDCSIATEDLLPVADILITDYSSILFDYLIFNKPIILFAPDYDNFKKTRGFYIEYNSLPGPIAYTAEELLSIIDNELWKNYTESLENCKKYYMQSCDGHVTGRILNELGLAVNEENY